MLSICFKYLYHEQIALNHEQIEKDLQRIAKIMPFTDQYHWKDILKTGKYFNQIINQLPLIFCMCLVILKIRHAYMSKHNSKSENQVILLMTTNDDEK